MAALVGGEPYDVPESLGGNNRLSEEVAMSSSTSEHRVFTGAALVLSPPMVSSGRRGAGGSNRERPVPGSNVGADNRDVGVEPHPRAYQWVERAAQPA